MEVNNDPDELEINKDFAKMMSEYKMQSLPSQADLGLMSHSHNNCWTAYSRGQVGDPRQQHNANTTGNSDIDLLSMKSKISIATKTSDNPVHFDLSAYEDLIEGSGYNDDDENCSDESFNNIEFSLDATYNSKTMSRKQVKTMLNVIAECDLENTLQNSTYNDDDIQADYNTSSEY